MSKYQINNLRHIYKLPVPNRVAAGVPNPRGVLEMTRLLYY